MMRRIFAFALGFATLALATAPLGAQPHAEQLRMCRDDSRDLPAETVVASCTALLDAGPIEDIERAELLLHRARAYRSRRDHARALADYDAALAIDPEFDWAHFGRGAVFRERGDPALALAPFTEAIRIAERNLAQLAPGSPEHAEDIRRLAWGYFSRAVAHGLLFDHRREAIDYSEAMQREPADPDIANGLCWSLAASGGDLVEARAACDTSLRLRPGHGPTLDSRGMVNLKQGRFADAWNDYDAAVRAMADHPRIAIPIYGRGIAALQLGRTDDGEADLARARALDPGVDRFYARYGFEPSARP